MKRATLFRGTAAVFVLWCSTLLAVGAPVPAGPEVGRSWQLRASALADSGGIFLDQLISDTQGDTTLHLRLAAAPPIGQVTSLSVAQVSALVKRQRPDLADRPWSGARAVAVTRRLRLLEETELKQMLATALQRTTVKDKGELEIRFSRPWLPVHVPDESLTLNILDLPSAGVTANFIVRFEARAGSELAGIWQLPLQAKVWREVWVARSPSVRGELVAEADLTRERRDVLGFREAPALFDAGNALLELAENIAAGAPVYSRSVRVRPVVRRGKILDAVLQDGALTMTIKAEVLEDGIPGQIVRARNLSSRREFRGKVQNEQELLVSL